VIRKYPNVGREAHVKALVDRTVAAFGRLDFAFNKAGIEGAAGLTVDKQTEENYRQTFDVNVLGVLFSMEHEIPAILKNGDAVVNTSSVAGQIRIPGSGVYTASKHAVNGLTRSAALEFAKQGVRVNAAVFGTVDMGILIWNFEGEIVEANDSFLKMVEHDREDLVKGRVRWTDLTNGVIAMHAR
jgi:NAD(P)-dependent dehydrogenase (short-subunit alcohol dehydrogenase family)